MRSSNDIKKRMRSIDSIATITNAMYLISSSKIRKAMHKYENNRYYFTKVQQAMKHLLSHMPDCKNAYFLPDLHERPKTAYVVISSDKSMAGAYNHNVCTSALEHIQAHEQEVYIFTVGNMARNFFLHHGYHIDIEFTDVIDKPELSHARRIMRTINGLFESNLLDEVYVVYTHMISSMSQQVRVQRLLPLLLSDFDDVQFEEGFIDSNVIYEPSPITVMTTLVPQYLEGMLYAMLVQSYASEHSMRMAAMNEASKNAANIVEDLHLEYNGIRQAAITEEIIEIVTGSSATV